MHTSIIIYVYIFYLCKCISLLFHYFFVWVKNKLLVLVTKYSRAPLLRGFGYNAVGRGPRISAARGKCQMGPLKPT